MSEFTEQEKQDYIKIINDIEKTVQECRKKYTEKWQLELLDEIETKLHERRK